MGVNTLFDYIEQEPKASKEWIEETDNPEDKYPVFEVFYLCETEKPL